MSQKVTSLQAEPDEIHLVHLHWRTLQKTPLIIGATTSEGSYKIEYADDQSYGLFFSSKSRKPWEPIDNSPNEIEAINAVQQHIAGL